MVDNGGNGDKKAWDIHPAKLTLLVLVPTALIAALLVLFVLLLSPELLT